MVGHRKTVKHYHEPGDCHELTFSCYRRLPLLTNDPWRKLLARQIDTANEHHAFRLVAFVLMPEHLHLLVYPVGGSEVSDLLKAIKKPFSFRIKGLLKEQNSPLLDLEGVMIFAVVLGVLGVVAWGGFTKHRSLGIAMTALIVAFVAAGCGFYAFVESQSLPWTIGYGVSAGLALAVGLKHLIGKWKKHRAL